MIAPRATIIAALAALLSTAPATARPEPAPATVIAQENDAGAAEIRAADAAWSRALGSKNLPRALAAVTPDAVLVAPHHPAAVGRHLIRTALTQLFAQRAFAVNWSPIDAGVSGSGDLGYSRGRYSVDAVASGQRIHDRGSYAAVWKKIDGSWKVSIAIFSSELPAR